MVGIEFSRVKCSYTKVILTHIYIETFES